MLILGVYSVCTLTERRQALIQPRRPDGVSPQEVGLDRPKKAAHSAGGSRAILLFNSRKRLFPLLFAPGSSGQSPTLSGGRFTKFAKNLKVGTRKSWVAL